MTEYLGPTNGGLKYFVPQRNRGRTLYPETSYLPILAFDPGGTTGWSLLVLKRNSAVDVFNLPFEEALGLKHQWFHGEVNCYENGEDGAAFLLMKLIDDWPTAAVVCEDFILRASRHEKTRDLLSPVRITAKLEHHLWRRDRRLWLQQPAQAKTTCTDARLKTWKCYTADGGLRHARDADRHALLFLRRCMSNKEFREQAWPDIYSTRRSNGTKT